jgi:hypothetical protein
MYNMLLLRLASALFSIGSFAGGVYAGHEAFEMAAHHAAEQQDGLLTPLEQNTNETPAIYILTAVGGLSLAGSAVAAVGLLPEEKSAKTPT